MKLAAMFWKTHSKELRVGSSRKASSSQPAKSKVLVIQPQGNEFSHNLSELGIGSIPAEPPNDNCNPAKTLAVNLWDLTQRT